MINIKTIILFLLISTSVLLAQTPSEIRKQKMKEKESEQQIKGEEKNLTPSQKRAQKEQEEKGEKIFGDDDLDFKTNEVPDKWKNESAVILCQKTSYSFLYGKVPVGTNMGTMMEKNYILKEIVRRKIKLLDKASVEAYSEFSFLDNSGKYSPVPTYLGIRIIKPNGTMVDVDTKKAIEVNPLNVSARYINTEPVLKKIAIPGLEIGDIMDYYMVQESSFSPYVFTLDAEYPIVTQKTDFKIWKDLFFNLNSYNGAPKLMEVPSNKNGKNKDEFKTYIIEDKNREKKSKEIWNYQYLTSPTIKFQVIHEESKMTKESLYFIGEVGKVNSIITDKDIQFVLGNIFKSDRTNTYSYPYFVRKVLKRDVLQAIKKSREKDPAKILQVAYYYMRYLQIEDLKKYNKYEFVSAMLSICEEYEVKAEVFAVAEKEYGSIKDILLLPELSIGVVAHLNGKDIFFSPPNDFSTSDVINSEIQGAAGIAFIPSVKTEFKNKKITIPASLFSDNAIVYTSDVALDDQFENIKIKRKTVMSGLCKTDYQSLALYGTSYVLNDKNKFEGDNESSGNKGRVAETKRKENEKNKELLTQKMDKLKDNLKDDFDVVSYDKFEVLSDGRYDESPDLSFNEAFTIKNLINKAGKNYVFDIGKLIGKQLELDESEKRRDHDIYRPFPKSFTNEIVVAIPAGYTVEGLNDLNLNVDNESGSFISSAKMEGNKIIIKTFKSYKKSFDKKENWPKLLDAIETAYKFTQKKVIIKKV